jgi:formamidopyrimidine-DNA glycosylase
MRVERVARRGKHQLVHLADGRVLHVHFRMNGDWVFDRVGDPLPRFARAVFQFTNGRRVVLEDSRAFSTIDVHPAEAELSLDLGPEPSDPTLTPSTFLAALQRRRIPIKVALLNQRIIAGLGNIYASEALWRAKLDPKCPAGTLTLPVVRRLLAAIRVVIRRATGSRYTESEAARLDVYDREGRPCRRCRTPIERFVQAGRSTYYCPHCQHFEERKALNRPLRARRSSGKSSPGY